MNKIFFHVDLDAFFASVEQLDHPEYRGKPVIVGGKPGEPRGVVSTASYEARKYGVHSAMPTAMAFRLCPEGIFVHGNYKRYSEKSEEVMAIFKNYSPDVQQMSIDEAFLDMTGTENLFGKPEDTARKLKKEIKEKTGLTVSIGIASNKYIAKIASGLEKPDGLTIIEPGKEELFMLNLPLDKVWGVGKKTYERLMSLQLKTTKEIHSRSLSILQNLMGTSTGAFIYNAVRGLEAETFTTETKNHSISAENTFETDLTYSDQFDYALLELSQVVFFRILKERVKSKTVHLKIRYDDFTTVSIQETFSSYVSSSDDLYTKVKKLFSKKYVINRGVRLLGIGLSNVEPSDAPSQGELFDFGQKNKAKVEAAILKATEKNPGIKITKASLLKKMSIILGVGLFLFSSPDVHGQTVTETERNSDGASSIVFNTRNISPYFDRNKTSVFNYNIDDNEIDFMATGWWQSSFSKAFTMSFGFGTDYGTEIQPAIFAQNVDLDLWLMINKHWYFETAFADGFENNTVAAGYTGTDLVKDFRLANRGIVFPSTYSIDDAGKGIGGGNNSAPGVHLKMGSDNFVWDTVLRYDMMESYEKSWQGTNTISTDNIELSNWHTGYKYAIPLNSAAQIKDVFVEKYDGSFTKIDHNYFLTQHLQDQETDILFLSQDAKAGLKSGKLPKVIVEFNTPVTLGSWTDEDSFLGKVQKVFEDINLEKYAYDYGNNTTKITIQNPDGFSPFVFANMYDAGVTGAGDGKIASKTTETAITKYQVTLQKETTTFVSKDFINQNHVFATVYSTETTASDTKALERYPLAKDDPAIYLGYRQSQDFVLRIRTLTKTNRLDIGSKAIPGTVKVYKNGTLDNGAKYDCESGTITLSTTINETDHIYAQWYQDSEDTATGAVTFASGIEFNIVPNLTGDFSIASRWSYTPEETYSTTQTSSPGSTTVATRLNWDKDNIKIKNTAAFTVENADTSGTLRLLSMENDKETFYLSKGSSMNLPDSIVPILDGFSCDLLKEHDGSLTVSKGHKDSSISGYAIPFSWKFESAASALTPNWAAITIATPGISSTLKNSSSFSIAIKPASLPSDTTVFLQLGVQAEEDFKVESPYLPCWDITEQLSASSEWKTITVNLTNEQKSRIQSNTSVRLIATSQSLQSGTIYAGPYKTDGTLFNYEQNDDFDIYMANEQDPTLNSSKIKELNDSKNYVQFINYKTSSGTILSQKEELKFHTYFDETDISLYKKAKVWIKKDSSLKGLKFEMVRPNESGLQTAAVKVEFSEEQLDKLTDNTYYCMTFDFKNKIAKAGNLTVPFYANTDIVPSRLNLTLITDRTGSFAIDELIFTEPVSSMDFMNKTQMQFQTSTDFFKKIAVDSTVQESYTTTDSKDSTSLIETHNKIEFSTEYLTAGINTSTSSKGKAVPQGSHSLNTSRLFDMIQFSENFSFDSTGSVFAKSNEIKLDLSKTSIPLTFNINSDNTKDLWSSNQNMNNQLLFNSKAFTSKTILKLSQQDSKISSFEDNYFESYSDITKFQFSTGSKDNKKRTEDFNEHITFKIPYTPIKPQLNYTVSQNYKNTTSTLYTNSITSSLNLPFNFKSNSFIVSWTKQGSCEESSEQKKSYSDDINYLFKNQKNLNWYYKALPVSDFIQSFVTKDDYNSVSYSGFYRLGWKRSFSASKYDFFIPTSAGFNFSRDITLTDDETDLYQYQTYATFTAMNVFGQTGTIHLFDFFEQDSYISNFQAAIKMPSNSYNQAVTTFSGYLLSDFRINSSDLLKNAFEGSFEGNDEWTIKDTLSWSRQVPSSILASIAELFTERPEKGFVITRKDSLNLTFSQSEETKKQIIQYLHGTDVQVNKYVTINSDFEFSYDATWNKIIYLNALGTLGITIKF